MNQSRKKAWIETANEFGRNALNVIHKCKLKETGLIQQQFNHQNEIPELKKFNSVIEFMTDLNLAEIKAGFL